MTHLFFVLDGFTRTRFSGNPAGVVLSPQAWIDSQMRAVAGELHLETAFAWPADGESADWTVAYATGAKRIPLCGHDTIALATVLAQTGRLPPSSIVRLATDVGILSVEVAPDGLVTMTQALPTFGAFVSPSVVADALGLPPSEIADAPPQIVSTGTPFLLVPLRTRAALNALAPDLPRLAAFLDGLDVAGLYAFALTDGNLHARCFCPGAGLPEDPVTGTASGAVGAYLAQRGLLTADENGKVLFTTTQGEAMGRPGNVRVRVKTANGEILQVQVSGRAVLVASGTLWTD